MISLPKALRPSVYIVGSIACAILVLFGIYYPDVQSHPRTLRYETSNWVGSSQNPFSSLQIVQSIGLGAQYFLDYPLRPPYRDIFGELGQRARILRSWIEELEAQGSYKDQETVANFVERVTRSLFPYLEPPLNQGTLAYSPPLANIRTRIGLPTNSTSSSSKAGIVIPAGNKTLRFVCHLIASLTHVHKTKLPIQVAYAGDRDLSEKGRETIQNAGDGREIELINVLSVSDDRTLNLADGGWAIKPFAILASRFDEVILLDADAVFFQDPEELLRQDRYRETGALLFHDRLLWKNEFPNRHDWWHGQLKHPSDETLKSLVWTERYSEEGDSGLIVLDKSRLEILIGLLHIGWQNSYDVREWTYDITYGDKETWWIGFEATESSYAFSSHYGGIVGWLDETSEDIKNNNKDNQNEKTEKVRVCSFVIAHVDQMDKLLWYNGSLLKNKLANTTAFEIPTHWMIDQDWEKGRSKLDMSCMTGTKALELSKHEKETLEKAINVAAEVDSRLGLL